MKVDIDPETLSTVIGKIYDSAVDPALWPVALEAMCGLIGATLGTVAVIDFKHHSIRFGADWGFDPHWKKLHDEKYAALMPFYSVYPRSEVGDTDNTQTLMDKLGDQNARQSPFFTEWAEPAGYRDCTSSIILRTDSQVGMFTMQTPTTRDLVGPNDLAVAALLSPHVRRAVTISD